MPLGPARSATPPSTAATGSGDDPGAVGVRDLGQPHHALRPVRPLRGCRYEGRLHGLGRLHRVGRVRALRGVGSVGGSRPAGPPSPAGRCRARCPRVRRAPSATAVTARVTITPMSSATDVSLVRSPVSTAACEASVSEVTVRKLPGGAPAASWRCSSSAASWALSAPRSPMADPGCGLVAVRSSTTPPPVGATSTVVRLVVRAACSARRNPSLALTLASAEAATCVVGTDVEVRVDRHGGRRAGVRAPVGEQHDHGEACAS